MFLSHELTKLKMGTRALHITATTPLDLYTMGAPIEGILSDGTARPLSHHNGDDRCLSAHYDGLFCFFQARHGITIGYHGPLGFPVPGHLADIHPSLKWDARLAGITPSCNKEGALLSLASAFLELSVHQTCPPIVPR